MAGLLLPVVITAESLGGRALTGWSKNNEKRHPPTFPSDWLPSTYRAYVPTCLLLSRWRYYSSKSLSPILCAFGLNVYYNIRYTRLYSSFLVVSFTLIQNSLISSFPPFLLSPSLRFSIPTIFSLKAIIDDALHFLSLTLLWDFLHGFTVYFAPQSLGPGTYVSSMYTLICSIAYQLSHPSFEPFWNFS